MLWAMKGHIFSLRFALGSALWLCTTTSVFSQGAATQATGAKISDPSIVGEEVAVLTQAPNVPPPINRSRPTRVVVTLEVKEVVRKLADGTEYLFWTFGGE